MEAAESVQQRSCRLRQHKHPVKLCQPGFNLEARVNPPPKGKTDISCAPPLRSRAFAGKPRWHICLRLSKTARTGQIRQHKHKTASLEEQTWVFIYLLTYFRLFVGDADSLVHVGLQNCAVLACVPHWNLTKWVRNITEFRTRREAVFNWTSGFYTGGKHFLILPGGWFLLQRFNQDVYMCSKAEICGRTWSFSFKPEEWFSNS